MARIAVLSEELINKIAAGEVVERPASVVKELCENSLDAGATVLRVSIGGGGLSAICVTDDGCGMSREDAVAALGRHATSKLKELDDLFRIFTMGFRGEAVPAIASVSRFTLTTGEHGAPVGTRLRLEGGGGLEVEDAPPLCGTRVDVEDLFFNVPARRKFLRREQTELAHCQEAVVRLALAHPEVGFHLESGGRTLLSAPACRKEPEERIAAALGPEVRPHLLSLDERRLGVRVWGHIASPELTFPNARGIYAFVNRRYVRDRGLNHAIQRAFQEALPPGRQPLAILFIELDPRAVDVNVHPQKLEVRFSDARGVYDAVLGAVGRALRSAPWLRPEGPGPTEPLAGAHYAQAVERFLERAQGGSLFAPPLPLPSAADAPLLAERPAFGQARPGVNEAPPPGYFGSLRHLGTLGKRFLVCEGQGGTLVVVDPHAALERVRLSELLRGGAIGAQGSLFAAPLELPPAEVKRVEARLDVLARLGIALEPFGGNAFAVASLPPALEGVELRRLVLEVLPVLPQPGVEAGREALLPAFRILACHAAGPSGRAMSEEELRALFSELDRADFHSACVHGTVVVTELPFLELERRAHSSPFRPRDPPPEN